MTCRTVNNDAAVWPMTVERKYGQVGGHPPDHDHTPPPTPRHFSAKNSAEVMEGLKK